MAISAIVLLLLGFFGAGVGALLAGLGDKGPDGGNMVGTGVVLLLFGVIFAA
jgi:ABC-type transport system involved in multi-copper enzyme maturation permease subunit